MPRDTGAFVYQGSGRRHAPDAPPEQRLCEKETLATQRCMSRNASRQDRCLHEVEAWKRCVRRVKEAHAAGLKNASPTK